MRCWRWDLTQLVVWLFSGALDDRALERADERPRDCLFAGGPGGIVPAARPSPIRRVQRLIGDCVAIPEVASLGGRSPSDATARCAAPEQPTVADVFPLLVGEVELATLILELIGDQVFERRSLLDDLAEIDRELVRHELMIAAASEVD